MPRRKKETASTDAESSSVKSAKKKKRVGIAVRVAKDKPKPVVKTEVAAEVAAPAQVAVPVAVAAPVKPVEMPQASATPAPVIQPAVPTPAAVPAEAKPVTEKTSRPYSDKEKSMIMWTAIIFIMIMVFGLWFMSIKLQLQSNIPDSPADQFDFSKVSDDISQAMQEVNDSLKQLATTTPTSTPADIATSTVRDLTATSTGEIASTTSLDAASIQRTIRELEAQLNRSTTTATSTAR